MKSLATLAVAAVALILGGLHLTSATDAFQSDRPSTASESRVESI